ncbi:MAG: hypothetical protein KDD70_05955 [Bdellovibrionales bacterium]|nr:hypothetical protein [Bdellovibrionales bacterium]
MHSPGRRGAYLHTHVLQGHRTSKDLMRRSEIANDLAQAAFHDEQLARQRTSRANGKIATADPIELARLERRATLPIYDLEEQLMQVLERHPIAIVIAPTGTGKSTQLPQMFLERGKTVELLQPRKDAAERIAMRISEEVGEELGGVIGFAHAKNMQLSRESKVIVTTDGWSLSAGLHTKNREPDVRILDEFHVGNVYQDTILALHLDKLARWERGEGPKPPKIVIATATFDAEYISRKLGGAPILETRGRNFNVEVETLEKGETIAERAIEAARDGDVLVFLAGKQEISAQKKAILDQTLEFEVLEGHSKLPAKEIARIFAPSARNKIILGTDMFETSHTLEGVKTVICSGYKRSIELQGGVETLAIHPISYFDFLQQIGRAGRVADGVAVYAGDIPLENLPKKPIREIQRIPLAKLDLTLAVAGKEIERLPYLEQPPHEHVEQGRKTLRQLSLFSANDRPTKAGARVAALPADIREGKMIAYAERLVERDKSLAPLLELAVDLASIIEAEGIARHDMKKKWEKFTSEKHSDLLAHLQVMHAAESLEKPNLRAMGIDEVALKYAQETREMLTRRLKLGERPEEFHQLVKQIGANGVAPVNPQVQTLREKLLESIFIGHMDSVFHMCDKDEKGNYGYRSLQGGAQRRLGRGSVVSGAANILGRAFDVMMLNGDGNTFTLPLVLMATEIDLSWLKKNGSPELKRDLSSSIRSIEDRARRGESKERQSFPYGRQHRAQLRTKRGAR